MVLAYQPKEISIPQLGPLVLLCFQLFLYKVSSLGSLFFREVIQSLEIHRNEVTKRYLTNAVGL